MRRMKTRLYPSIEPCPCGSGLSYGDCCRKKKFRFEVDKRGNVLKAVKIHPRLKPVLEDTLTRFREVFGRKPGKDDPAMFEQYLTGEQDYWQIVERIGKSAGIRDELIFAYRRSGFIVGEHSRDLMSASEYKE
jgi:hypothetical protein